jgi:hypothetical protein
MHAGIQRIPDDMVCFSNSPYGTVLWVENLWIIHIANDERERKDESEKRKQE